MEPAGIGLVVRGAIIGVGLSILLLLIPIVHFIVGPFGPLIGGYVGGGVARATPGRALGIGVLMAFFMAAPTFLTALALDSLGVWASAQEILTWVAGILAVWAGLLGTVGAYFGGRASGSSGVIIIRGGRFGRRRLR